MFSIKPERIEALYYRERFGETMNKAVSGM